MEKYHTNRRGFIKTAAVGGAGALALRPSFAPAANPGGSSMKDMKVALLQIHSDQNDFKGNMTKIITRAGDAAKQGANLMVSCELGLTAFQLSRDTYVKLAQTIPGPATEELGLAAKKANAYLIAGLVEKDGGDIYNALAVLGPKGNLVAGYRKTHLWLTENQTFARGNKLCVFDTEFGKIGTSICYDIMYPEYIRAIAAQGAGIITHSTGMVTTEDCDKFGWDPEFYNAFVRTRAWENQVYIPSCNRCGNDLFLYFLANSCVATPWGTIADKLGNAEGTLVVKTDFARLTEWQKIAPYWDDRRPDFYKTILDF
ncbi:MAG: carbon-nitrogen hydrolase family protein [Candidatus Latescibacteria bacterium]|nr:carbon-nitrogen hydrolase family protein [Candidatus Latescibacterota bacterium]